MKLLALTPFITYALAAPGNPVEVSFKVGPNGNPNDTSGCNGEIQMFTYANGRNIIKWDLKNCGPAGQHGFHIHAVNDFSDGCSSTGGHFNPTGLEHGGTKDKIRHVGDIPMITVNADGTAKGISEDSDALLTGPYSVAGYPLVIHEGKDDEGKGGEECSKSNGCAGPRIACGLVPRV